MSEDRKTLRTDAYKSRKGYEFCYWVMSPAYQKPGYQIRQHDVAQRSSLSSRIADEMPEREALLKMAELERSAQATMTRIDDEDPAVLERLGDDYRNAAPHAPLSQAILTGMNATALKNRPKPPKLKPSP